MSLRRFFLASGALAASALQAVLRRVTSGPGPASDTLRLSIEEAVSRAVRQSDETRLSAAQLEVTEAQITTARAAGLPQLRLNGAYTQVIENARANIVGSVFAQAFTYNTNANLSQTIFQGGRIFAGTRAAARCSSGCAVRPGRSSSPRLGRYSARLLPGAAERSPLRHPGPQPRARRRAAQAGRTPGVRWPRRPLRRAARSRRAHESRAGAHSGRSDRDLTHARGQADSEPAQSTSRSC